MPDWNNSNVAGHTRLEPKMRQIRQYKKGGNLSQKYNIT